MDISPLLWSPGNTYELIREVTAAYSQNEDSVRISTIEFSGLFLPIASTTLLFFHGQTLLTTAQQRLLSTQTN